MGPAANPFLGVLFHAIGGLSAALFYTPHHKARKWSWETYWLVQAFASWLILPIVGAVLTIPELSAVLREAPKDAMIRSFAFGALYGIGGTAFGLAIRYVGYSLTYAIAIGFSCIIGTLLPPLLDHKLLGIVNAPGGTVVLVGVVMGVGGMALGGLAGRMKESSVTGAQSAEFSFAKGMPLCILSGALSAVFNFALIAGQPIADVAAKHDAGIWQSNVIYIFAMSGAFCTTTAYCLWLGFRNKTWAEFNPIGSSDLSHLPLNYILAAIGGGMWYLQFLFYGLGHLRLGQALSFSSWAIHMTMLIFFSNLLGIVMKEWKSCEKRAVYVMNFALAVLLAAIAVIGYGNYLAPRP